LLLWTNVLRAAARLHVAVTRNLLGPPEDPLKEAKELLACPGALGSFMAWRGLAAGPCRGEQAHRAAGI
jgi:hypothetical protein